MPRIAKVLLGQPRVRMANLRHRSVCSHRVSLARLDDATVPAKLPAGGSYSPSKVKVKQIGHRLAACNADAPAWLRVTGRGYSSVCALGFVQSGL